MCWELTTQDGIQVGEICLEFQSANNVLEVSFEAAPYWSFVNHHLWSGSYVSEVPKTQDGHLNEGTFPYYFCSSDGESRWSFTLPTGCNILSKKNQLLSLVSISRAAQVYPTSKAVIDGTEELVYIGTHRNIGGGTHFGWLDFDVACSCSLPPSQTSPPTPTPSHPPSQTLPPSSIGGTIPPQTQDKACLKHKVGNAEDLHKECHPILASADKMQVGTVCADVIDISTTSQLLKLVFRAEPGWAFTRNEMWIGSDIKRLPKREDGGPDLPNFPYFAYNSSGTDSWVAEVRLQCSQRPASIYTLIAVAQATVVPTPGNNSSQLKSFAVEHEGSRGLEFSWMDFLINCRCEKEAFPNSSTMVPKNAPTTVATGDYNTGHCTGQEPHKDGLCRKLISGRGDVVGSLCAKQMSKSNNTEIVFAANKYWSFVSQEMWIGNNLATLPMIGGDIPEFGTFPHVWRNQAGLLEWKVSIGITCNSRDQGNQKVYVVSRSSARQVNKDGMLLENTEEYVLPGDGSGGITPTWDWLYIELSCRAGEAQLIVPYVAGATCEGPSSLKFKDSPCGLQSIDLASECGTEPHGKIDFSIEGLGNTSSLDVMFRPSVGRSFTAAELWLGTDMSQMPRISDSGTPDFASFPYFASESVGRTQINFKEPLYMDCKEGNILTLFGVARAVTMQNDLANSTPQVTESSYAYEHDSISSEGWYGYFDFTIECGCPGSNNNVIDSSDSPGSIAIDVFTPLST